MSFGQPCSWQVAVDVLMNLTFSPEVPKPAKLGPIAIFSCAVWQVRVTRVRERPQTLETRMCLASVEGSPHPRRQATRLHVGRPRTRDARLR